MPAIQGLIAGMARSYSTELSAHLEQSRNPAETFVNHDDL